MKSYPSAREVLVEAMLDGEVEARLVAGYEWDRATRMMGPAVISLHDGTDEVVWVASLPAPG